MNVTKDRVRRWLAMAIGGTVITLAVPVLAAGASGSGHGGSSGSQASNNPRPSNPPCDADHGVPGAHVPWCPGTNPGLGHRPSNPPCDADHGVPGLHSHVCTTPTPSPTPTPTPTSSSTPTPTPAPSTTCADSQDVLIIPANPSGDETGTLSGPIHTDVEPLVPAPVNSTVHDVNCDVVVSLGF